MYIFVGLGNSGEKYVYTRHNAGRRALAYFVHERAGTWTHSAKYVGDIWEGDVGGQKMRALLPNTFMNESGGAVRKSVTNKKQAEELVVLYDDIDLPLGTVRVSFNRGSGGHNGIKSVAESIGTEAFVRIRIGISPSVGGKIKKPKTASAVLKWVMGDFSKAEEKKLDDVCAKVKDVMEHLVEKGAYSAMNTYNSA